MRVVLLHPPLLAPIVWRSVADRLRADGHAVNVPDLRAAVATVTGWFDRAVALGPGSADVVVAHSGAGVLVPLVVASCGAREAVFVDAITPAAQGETAPSEAMRAFAATRLDGDRLMRWTDWWPGDEFAALVLDPAVRAELAAATPRLPRDFYDVAVPVPDGWSDGVAIRYLQLSPAYDGDAETARARGWPVTRLDGTHLSPLTDPDLVVAHLLG